MQRQIVFQRTGLIGACRTVSSMVSQLLNVHIRELRLALMDRHGVIKPHKILVLNRRDRRIAHKIVLGNMLDLDRGAIARQFVFGAINGVGAYGFCGHFASFIHHGFLH